METGNNTQALLEMKFRPTAEVLVSRLGEEMVMLDLASELYFGLDPVGTSFWEALTTAPNAAAAIEALAGRYDVDRDMLARDLANLVAQLTSKGLLVVSDAACS